MTIVLPPVCDRMRALVSLELDGELSELEAVLLDGHVSTCSGCARFRGDSAALTNALRASTPEEPSLPIRLPARSRMHHARAPAVAAAAALVVAAIAAIGPLAPVPDGGDDAGGPANVVTTRSIDWDSAHLQGTSPRHGDDRLGGGGAGRLL